MTPREPLLKKSNVSYSNNPVTKSLAVPLLDDRYRFGTKLADPVWQKGLKVKDFEAFKKERLEKKSEMTLFRTRRHLLIGCFFYEKPSNIVRPENEFSNPWTGDLTELHFGDMEPDPWLWQIAVGVTGLCFDSSGHFDRWEAKHFETPQGWGVEMRFELSLFRLTEGGFRFNICRQALKRKEYSTWSPLQIRFHEVENFGEMLFTDYKTALQLKQGSSVTGPVSRAKYEHLRSKGMIPAQKVIHGPFLSAPDKGSVQISWATAGLVPSFLEYREKGSAAPFLRASSGNAHATLAHNTSHKVHLTGLTPGKEYEYEIFTLKSVVQEPESTGIKHFFKVPEENKNSFSFYCITDIHSDVGYIRRALATPEARSADFVALLGDNLSHAAGVEALYEGVVDPVLAAATVDNKDKPLVFLRGNHEQLGVYAKDYFTVMGHPSGESYYTFTWGNVFFIVLDSGNDHKEHDEGFMFNNRIQREKQTAFLKEVISSKKYQEADFRVLMLHIPPHKKNVPSEICDELYEMTEPLRKADPLPDVSISGHIHAYEKVNANENRYAPESDTSHIGAYPHVWVNPYPVIAHVNTAGLHCEVHPDAMILSVLDVSDAENTKLLDRIVLKKKHK